MQRAKQGEWVEGVRPQEVVCTHKPAGKCRGTSGTGSKVVGDYGYEYVCEHTSMNIGMWTCLYAYMSMSKLLCRYKLTYKFIHLIHGAVCIYLVSVYQH